MHTVSAPRAQRFFLNAFEWLCSDCPHFRKVPYETVMLTVRKILHRFMVGQSTQRANVCACPQRALLSIGPGSIESFRNRQDIESASGRSALERGIVHGQNMTEHAPIVIHRPGLRL